MLILKFDFLPSDQVAVKLNKLSIRYVYIYITHCAIGHSVVWFTHCLTCHVLMSVTKFGLVVDYSGCRLFSLPRSASCLQDNPWARTTQKTQSLCCCRAVFTTPLHSNGTFVEHRENPVLLLLRACMWRALPSNPRSSSRSVPIST
jgi:hypothetical protein